MSRPTPFRGDAPPFYPSRPLPPSQPAAYAGPLQPFYLSRPLPSSQLAAFAGPLQPPLQPAAHAGPLPPPPQQQQVGFQNAFGMQTLPLPLFAQYASLPRSMQMQLFSNASMMQSHLPLPPPPSTQHPAFQPLVQSSQPKNAFPFQLQHGLRPSNFSLASGLSRAPPSSRITPPVDPQSQPLRSSRPFTNPPSRSSRYSKSNKKPPFRPSRHSHNPPPRTSRRTPPVPQPQSTFLARLPGELRNRIYDLVVLSPEPVRAVREVRKTAEGVTLYASAVPALAQTCRQIRRECLDIYYAGNAFVFEPAPERGDAVGKGRVHSWVRTVTAAGFERLVTKVGCTYPKPHDIDDDDSESCSSEGGERESAWIIATLGKDNQPSPKVSFETSQPPFTGVWNRNVQHMHNVCTHLLVDTAAGFEQRRAGKSVRGYGALIDIALTVGDFLIPVECGHYLRGCPGCGHEMENFLVMLANA
ncbi:hypothetical protein Q7P37_006973 [Cladosporium fusiforme]